MRKYQKCPGSRTPIWSVDLWTWTWS